LSATKDEAIIDSEISGRNLEKERSNPKEKGKMGSRVYIKKVQLLK
jgi:hypothetical protein